jgi:hypothetical protein
MAYSSSMNTDLLRRRYSDHRASALASGMDRDWFARAAAIWLRLNVRDAGREEPTPLDHVDAALAVANQARQLPRCAPILDTARRADSPEDAWVRWTAREPRPSTLDTQEPTMPPDLSFTPADSLTDDLRAAMDRALASVPGYRGETVFLELVARTWGRVQEHLARVREAVAAENWRDAYDWLGPLVVANANLRPWNGPERDLVIGVRDAIQREAHTIAGQIEARRYSYAYQARA